ncbi:hypothetical protein BJ970_000040 [Saccharopolyspora phatthalungensis]|uniref:Uncharacterized protein n=1 Tax=Saccharopolyspora phatthalungensis TaxID=664693 RepID=A0A840PW05_9PSEU|nr:hypothetical protein [Saccharopolyspora phatthalungensis]
MRIPRTLVGLPAVVGSLTTAILVADNATFEQFRFW